MYSYVSTSENEKLCENTPPCGRRISTQFLVFPISTRVDITLYQHGKCFPFLKCYARENLPHLSQKLSALISTRNTNIYTKIRKLHMAIFSVIYNISPPNFAILPSLRCFFQL